MRRWLANAGLLGAGILAGIGITATLQAARQPQVEAEPVLAPADRVPEAIYEDRSTHPAKILALGLMLAIVVAGAIAAGYRWKADREQRAAAIALTAGDPDRAPAILARYGCRGCHTIPGVPGADGLVGPPLGDLARHVYVAGVLENTPDNLVTWIENPRGVNPRTAMPVTGITREEARHVAAYLYSLR